MRSLRKLHLSIVQKPHGRPATRGQCASGIRPCPFVGCRHHLAVDAGRSGSLKINFDPEDETRPSCSLDVSDAGPHSQDEVSVILNVTRTRVEQIEKQAMAKLLLLHRDELAELKGDD
jgi:hypothetical protein